VASGAKVRRYVGTKEKQVFTRPDWVPPDEKGRNKKVKAGGGVFWG